MRRALPGVSEGTFSFIVRRWQFRMIEKRDYRLPVVQNLLGQSSEFGMLCGSSQQTDPVEATGDWVIVVVLVAKSKGLD
jgi:hypothetical protein